MVKPKDWKKWIDPAFEGLSFEEIFGSVKTKKKKRKGVKADIDFDIGV